MYIHDNSEGVSHALTPICLIYGRRVATTPNGQYFDITITNKTFTKRAKHQFQMFNNFNRQLQREHLLSILEIDP